MTSEAARARKLLSVFRDRPLSVDPDSDEQRRARLVPILRAEVRERYRARERRSRFKLVIAACAAAACLAVGGGYLLKARGGQAPSAEIAAGSIRVEALAGQSVLYDGIVSRPLTLGERLNAEAGAELRTPATGWVRLRAAQGLALALAGETSLAFGGLLPVRGRSEVTLTRGSLDCDVPKLPAGEQFVVVTPDARVIVHGTSFSVKVVEVARGSSTCVRVREGRVAVQRGAEELWLGAGESSGCEQAQAKKADAPHEPAAAEPAALPRELPSRAPVVNKSRERLLASGTLAKETELLQAALSAERKRDFPGARNRLELLLARYPESPLGPEARQALARVSEAARGAR
jgi:hypothetical protein